MTRRLLLASLACAAGACHSVETFPPPPIGDAESALLVLETSQGEIGFVQALEPGAADFPTLSSRGGERLHLARLACDLDRLGLTPGSQALESMAAEPPRVPAPEATLSLALDEPGARWAEGAEAALWSEALGRLPVPEDNLCRLAVPPYRGEERIVEVFETQDIILADFAIDLRDGRVLVGTRFYPDLPGTSTTGAAAYRYDDTGGQPIFEVWPEVDALGPLLAGARLADGSMWLMGYERLWRGHPDTGFEVVTSTVFDRAIEGARLATSPDGADVYAVTQALTDMSAGGSFGADRRLLTLDGGAWREVYRHLENEAERDRVDVAWADGDRFVAIGLVADGAVLEVTRDGATPVPLGGVRKRHVQSLPSGGAAVTSVGGGLWVRGDGGWQTVRESGHPGFIELVQRRAGAWALFGWVGGGVGVPILTDDYGLCDADAVASGFPRIIAPVGGGALAMLSSVRGGTLRYARLEPRGDVGPLCP